MRTKGVAENSAGRPARAADLLRQALQLLDDSPLDLPAMEDHELRVRILLSLGVAEFELGGWTQAEPLLARAGDLARSRTDGAFLPHWHLQRGLLLARAGYLTRAEADLAAAVEKIDVFTPKEQCSLLINRGMLFAEASSPSRAIEDFRRAAAIAESDGLDQQVFMARHNEGFATYLLGDIPNALRLMTMAEAVQADVSQAAALLDRARILHEAGLLGEGEEVLLRAERHSVERQQGHLLAEIRMERAHSHLLQGRLDHARDLALSSQRAFQERDALAKAAHAEALLLAVALRAGEAPDRVEDDATSLGRSAAARGDVDLTVTACTLAAEASLMSGHPRLALEHLDAAPTAEGTSLVTTLQAAYVRARALADLGETTRARALVRASSDDLARGQEVSGSLDLRAARAMHGVRLSQLDLELSVGREARRVRDVMVALERWRTATERLSPVLPPHDPETARLSQQLRVLQFRLRQEPMTDQAAEWRARAAQLRRLIRARDWATIRHEEDPGAPRPEMTPPGQRITRRAVEQFREAAMAAERDVLWLFRYRDEIWGLGVVAGRARLRSLMRLTRAEELAQRVRADLAVVSGQQLGSLRGHVMRSLAASMAEFDATLLRPLGVGDRGLVLSPNRITASLPWSMAPSLGGVPVTMTPSLAAYVNRIPPAQAGPASLPSVHVSVGPEISRADEEASSVERCWAGRGAATSRSSRRSALVAALGEQEIVHVAAHGVHEDGSPLFSSLLLGDGHLFAHELQPHGVRTDHVVLSACDVGSATVRPGDEPLGMASTMLSLGARCVVAALAAVPHDLAVETMVRYHRGLAQGAATDEALAAAIAATDPLAGVFVSTGTSWRAARGGAQMKRAGSRKRDS